MDGNFSCIKQYKAIVMAGEWPFSIIFPETTMNVYGDVVTDEMTVASGKVARLALNGR
jgi:hypothetical protein